MSQKNFRLTNNLRLSAFMCLANSVLLCFLVLSLFGCSSRKELSGGSPSLAPLEYGSWGFIDKSSKFTILPQFNSGGEFKNGRAVVDAYSPTVRSRPTKILIDLKGRVLTRPSIVTKLSNEYADFGPFYDGVAVAKKPWSNKVSADISNQSYVLIDETGSIICSLAGEPLSLEFNEGFLVLRKKGRVGFADTTGRFLIEPKFALARGFHEGRAAVCTITSNQQRWGFIDKSGQFIVLPKYKSVADFSNGTARVEQYDSTNILYVDKFGKTVLSLPYAEGQEYGDFHDGLTCVRSSTTPFKVTFIDKQGKIAFSVDNLVDIGEFSEGLCYAAVRKAQHQFYGYIDRDGNWIIEPQFIHACNFSENLAGVCKYDAEREQSRERLIQERRKKLHDFRR